MVVEIRDWEGVSLEEGYSSKVWGMNGGDGALKVLGPYGVSLWKSIKQEWPTFSKYLQFYVGDGIWVKFWYDVWCGECPLKESFPDLFSISSVKDSLIAEVFNLANRVPLRDVRFPRSIGPRLGVKSLWSHLWILSIPRPLRVRGWIDFAGYLPKFGVLRCMVIITPFSCLMACLFLGNWCGVWMSPSRIAFFSWTAALRMILTT